MTSPDCITKHLQAALSCLEEDPPNWLGAAVHFCCVNSYGAVVASKELCNVMELFYTKIPRTSLDLFMKQVPHDIMEIWEEPLRFVYAIQLGRFRQAFIDSLSYYITVRHDNAVALADSLLKENAALKAKLRALTSAAQP
jgi:hypothetical protein